MVKVGIRLNQRNNLKGLITIAKPLVEEVLEDVYGKNLEVKIRVLRNKNKIVGAEVYAEMPNQPNGESMDIITGLDHALYVPLVENELTGTGYDFILGNKDVKDLWGYCELTKKRVEALDSDGAKSLSSKFLEGMRTYGIPVRSKAAA